MQEGVVQFRSEHCSRLLRPAESAGVASLLGWRSILRDTGLVGAMADRYGGLGFGNVSARVAPQSSARGQRAFVVSCTQTADVVDAGPAHFAVVTSYSVAENRVVSAGPCVPSSESLTHATIYDHGPQLRAVLHVHSPDIFVAHRRLKLPTTPAGVDYGTVAMAEATADLFRAGRVHETRAFVMLGHEDGVVAFGRSVDEAGARLMCLLAEARQSHGG